MQLGPSRRPGAGTTRPAKEESSEPRCVQVHIYIYTYIAGTVVLALIMYFLLKSVVLAGQIVCYAVAEAATRMASITGIALWQPHYVVPHKENDAMLVNSVGPYIGCWLLHDSERRRAASAEPSTTVVVQSTSSSTPCARQRICAACLRLLTGDALMGDGR